MMISKTAKVPQAPIARPGFKIVCINCDSLGIVFDSAEGAPTLDPGHVPALRRSARNARRAARPFLFRSAGSV